MMNGLRPRPDPTDPIKGRARGPLDRHDQPIAGSHIHTERPGPVLQRSNVRSSPVRSLPSCATDKTPATASWLGHLPDPGPAPPNTGWDESLPMQPNLAYARQSPISEVDTRDRRAERRCDAIRSSSRSCPVSTDQSVPIVTLWRPDLPVLPPQATVTVIASAEGNPKAITITTTPNTDEESILPPATDTVLPFLQVGGLGPELPRWRSGAPAGEGVVRPGVTTLLAKRATLNSWSSKPTGTMPSARAKS